jgi:hypothetical protein
LLAQAHFRTSADYRQHLVRVCPKTT